MKQLPRALVALTAVLLVSAVLWLVLIGQAALHLNQTFASESASRSLSVQQLAQGCLELALRGLTLNQNYQGENLSWADQSCIINASQTNGTYVFAISAKSAAYSKKFVAQVTDNNGRLSISAWQENQ